MGKLVLVLLVCVLARVVGAEELKGTISLSGAFALYPMAVKWAEEFKKVNPGVKIDISAGGAGKGVADCLGGMVDGGMVSRDLTPEEAAKGAFGVPVAKDAVLPVVCAQNPYLKTLLEKGLKKADFEKVWLTPSGVKWNDLLPGCDPSGAVKVNPYTRSDACGAGETWAKYLGKKQEELEGTAVFGDPGLAAAVLKDANGVGYNNVAFAYDSKTLKEIKGLRVIPIDLNGDGSISADESFYGDRATLIKAIAEGRYPSPPARQLYIMTKGVPTNPLMKAFLVWILKDGQQYLGDAGYVPVSDQTLKDALAKLGSGR